MTPEEIRRRVDAVPVWYHTFEFPGGIVTPAHFDHRDVIHKLPFPESMQGLRCMDLASCNGLFAFEMARRGGAVVSVDLDDETKVDWQGAPPPADPHIQGGKSAATLGFETAREILGLDVERVQMSLYDVSPELLGTFDFVFIGSVLLHLSDPVRALKAARSITTGRLLSFDVVSMGQTLLRPRTATALLCEEDLPRFWTTNARGHRRLLEAAEFTVEASKFPLFQKFGSPMARRPSRPPWKWPGTFGSYLAYWLFTVRVGVPSQWVLCR